MVHVDWVHICKTWNGACEKNRGGCTVIFRFSSQVRNFIGHGFFRRENTTQNRQMKRNHPLFANSHRISNLIIYKSTVILNNYISWPVKPWKKSSIFLGGGGWQISTSIDMLPPRSVAHRLGFKMLPAVFMVSSMLAKTFIWVFPWMVVRVLVPPFHTPSHDHF